MNIVAIVQARMASVRLPGKVLKDICGFPMISLVMNRLSKSTRLKSIILATTENQSDNCLADYVKNLGYKVFRGNDEDVLDRYYQAASDNKADYIVRITADCPLIDPVLVDEMVGIILNDKFDYVSNTIEPTYPDGLDVEVFSFSALKKAWLNAKDPYEREHVTPYIKTTQSFSRYNLANKKNLSSYRWTVDESEDLILVREIFSHFSPKIDFSWPDILSLEKIDETIFSKNIHYSRNQGASMCTGQKLWSRAKRVIPGGNMLLSKRPEMYLPTKWPTYFSRAKGCEIWDLDKKKYIDMSVMGVGTNVLGYGDPDVDRAVKRVVSLGNMSTFNCPEEVYLSEKLIELHPWAEMVRLARTGGEANALAIRVARCATGRDKIAICGYHGWHDWYLAANIQNGDNLNKHLLPGLLPNGVPENLSGTIFPFHYNNFTELEQIVSKHDLAAIKMEVSRNIQPDLDFLCKIRQLADKKNIVLIFDECTSGFRQCFGGLHKLYGVDPDMAVFGKTLGNGYAISAVIGRRFVMDAAQSTFISSTFWTERIGPTAALKTLEVMERENSWVTISQLGLRIRDGWSHLAKKHNLPTELYGLPSMSSFKFSLDNMMKYKTYITQELLKKGFLATNTIYTCIKHTENTIQNYLEELDYIFYIISCCELGQYSIDELLDGPICHEGFSRLN